MTREMGITRGILPFISELPSNHISGANFMPRAPGPKETSRYQLCRDLRERSIPVHQYVSPSFQSAIWMASSGTM